MSLVLWHLALVPSKNWWCWRPYGLAPKMTRFSAWLLHQTPNNTPLTTLTPLCPTKRTMWNSALNDVLGKYEWVVGSLGEVSKSTSETGSTASGLFEPFSKGKTVPGPTLASCWRAWMPNFQAMHPAWAAHLYRLTSCLSSGAHVNRLEQLHNMQRYYQDSTFSTSCSWF